MNTDERARCQLYTPVTRPGGVVAGPKQGERGPPFSSPRSASPLRRCFERSEGEREEEEGERERERKVGRKTTRYTHVHTPIHPSCSRRIISFDIDRVIDLESVRSFIPWIYRNTSSNERTNVGRERGGGRSGREPDL